MNNKDFNLKFDAYKDFLRIVSAAIGYNSQLNCDVDDCYIDAKYQLNDDEITIIDGDDEYCFSISSYSAQGKDLFCGEINDLFLVMAYQDNWEIHSVYVLRKSNMLSD